jgi:hypothetical protein
MMLHNGDEVTIPCNDEPGGLRTIIISEIEYLPDEVVRMRDKEGNNYVCGFYEIK